MDALTDHDLLAEADWKESAVEIVGELLVLRSAPHVDELWASLAESELPTYESDCYPLVLLPAVRADDLVSFVSAAGFTAEVLGR